MRQKKKQLKVYLSALSVDTLKWNQDDVSDIIFQL